MHNQIKTVIGLDKDTTLELQGRRGSNRIEAELRHSAKEDEMNGVEGKIVRFSLTEETIRNLSHVLDGYR